MSGLKGSLRKGQERGFPRPVFVFCVSQDVTQELDGEADGPKMQFSASPRDEAAFSVTGERSEKGKGGKPEPELSILGVAVPCISSWLARTPALLHSCGGKGPVEQEESAQGRSS